MKTSKRSYDQNKFTSSEVEMNFIAAPEYLFANPRQCFSSVYKLRLLASKVIFIFPTDYRLDHSLHEQISDQPVNLILGNYEIHVSTSLALTGDAFIPSHPGPEPWLFHWKPCVLRLLYQLPSRLNGIAELNLFRCLP